MKETTSKYCAKCLQDFIIGEVVHYTWYENRCFCNDCQQIMNTRVKASYLDWQTRKVVTGEKDCEHIINETIDVGGGETIVVCHDCGSEL